MYFSLSALLARFESKLEMLPEVTSVVSLGKLVILTKTLDSYLLSLLVSAT